VKPYYFLFLIFYFVGCTESNHSSPDANANEYQLDQEKIFLSNHLGDTIETGTPQPFDRIGQRRPRSVNLLQKQGAETEIEQYQLNSNSAEIILTRASLFDQDSARTISLEDTAIDPPRRFIIEPTIRTAYKTERKKVAPAIYKDNAHYDIRSLTTDQGLPSNVINDIYKDSRDIVWLATDKGLSRFDGRFINSYTTQTGLSDNFLTCITEDQLGNIWVGTRTEGLIKFDGYKFYHYNLDSIATGRMVNDIAFDRDNELWCVIEFGGFAHFDGEVFYSYKIDQGVRTDRPTTTVSIDKENNKWITGYGVGLYLVDDDLVVHEMNNDASPRSGYINSCLITSQGDLLFSFWRGRFSMIKGDSVYVYDLKNLGHNDLLTNIVEDKNGEFWLGGYGSGIYHWDGKSSRIEILGIDQGLSSKYVSNVYCDDLDNIWVGTYGDGLCIIQPKSFENLNADNGLKSPYVHEIYEHGENVLFYATDEGILKHDSSGITHYLKGANHPADVIVDKNETIWISSVNGGTTYIRKDGKATKISNGQGGPYNPSCIDTTSNGDIWIGGMNADLMVIQADTIIYRYSREEGLYLHNLTDLLITDDDVFWIASSYQGIARLYEDSITYYSTNEKLKSNVVTHFLEDLSGRIWICTEEGINYFENGSLKSLDSENPVFKKNMKSMAQDQLGRYWIATDEGLITLVPKEGTETQDIFDLDNFLVFQFDKTNGLNNIVFLDNSILIDQNNVLHIGSKGGLISRDLNLISFKRTKPTSFLTDIGINGEIIDFGVLQDSISDESIVFNEILPFNNYPKSLELPHHLNHVTFEFSGFNWNDPSNLTFYYFLEGYETTWNKSRPDNFADYRNLAYGDYTFHLKSLSRDGLESDEFLFQLNILRPWWHTWWARTSYFLAFILFVVILIKWRTKNLQARQKELETEVEHATEKIRAQKDEVEKQKVEVEKAHDKLGIKNQEVLDSINYAKRIQGAILPSKKMIQDSLSDSFIIYKPKDIVAGDFYWVEPLENSTLFAVADCTGHGVPGAMVSMICNNALNRSVRLHNLEDPAKILDKTRDIVLEEFGGSEEGVQDGMDIAICKLSPAANGKTTLEYSGALNPLWIIRKAATNEDGYSLEEIKADKQPIGKFDKPEPFTKHTIELSKDDCFYIFTDGFSDQFGGEKGKKFKTANFKRLLISVQGKSIEEQGAELDIMFEDWKSDFEQLDDVCVIGVRV
jgi:ligand-binding sensor domain-containing protein/serine phosphatase RsbU (regulator of sigma subunit)